MADTKTTGLTSRGTPDRANDLIMVVNGTTNYKSTINNELGITGAPVGTTDLQTLTNKTFTAPTISGPTLSGTIVGTYTIGGTPTFPATVVLTSGNQTISGTKTFSGLVASTPTLTNASITQDAVVGFTTANSGTVYGIPITSSKLPGSSIANATVGPSQLATGAQSAKVDTLETTTSTSYTDLATVTDTVTVVVGANGLLLVNLYCQLFNSNAGSFSYVSFALSGANTLAASDANGIFFNVTSTIPLSLPILLTGLSPGSTVIKMKYRVGSNTGSFLFRKISAVPL